MIELRQYQQDSIDALREGIRAGHKRQILCSPTGSGKTEIAMALSQDALKKGSKTAFICDRIAILDQTSQRFDSNQIPHGIIQSGHWRWRPSEPAQICSAQTLARRGVMSGLKLIIVDECHTLYKSTVKFIEAHPEIVTIGLSASPFSKGLGALYSNIVNVTTTNKLIEEKYLTGLRVFAAKAIDMRGAKLKFDGEWMDAEIEKRGLEIVGDIVQEWVTKTGEIFGGPVKTILFSATVAHGEELCRQFQAAGFNFQQVSYKDGNDDSRRVLIEEFRQPDSEIMGLVSVEALAKGFDVPDIRCLVSAKPYRKILSGHIQQIGRGMRISPDKEFCLLLDHSGNFLRFYDDTMSFFERGLEGLGEGHLDSTARQEPEEKQVRELVCGNCRAVIPPGSSSCAVCGLVKPKKQNDTESLPGEMVELELNSKGKPLPDFLQDKDRVWRQICQLSLDRKSGDEIAAERFAKAQYMNIYGTWPRHAMRNITPEEPSLQLQSKIKANLIRYFKGKAKREAQA